MADKIKLRAPDGVCTVSHGGIEYEVAGGAVEVPLASIADELMSSHGFLSWTDAPKAEDDSSELPADADEFDAMNRAGLFAWLRSKGVAALPSHKDAELRAMARDAKAKSAPPAP